MEITPIEFILNASAIGFGVAALILAVKGWTAARRSFDERCFTALIQGLTLLRPKPGDVIVATLSARNYAILKESCEREFGPGVRLIVAGEELRLSTQKAAINSDAQPNYRQDDGNQPFPITSNEATDCAGGSRKP